MAAPAPSRSWWATTSAGRLDRGRATLVVATCLGMAVAVLALILTWLISRDLEFETVIAGSIFILLLGGIAALARRGRITLAGWLLVGLLSLMIAADTAAYGIASPTAAAFVIPIVLAACCLGLWPGLGVAAIGSVVAWVSALNESAGWYPPPEPLDISHLTFNAPALTVMFLLVALITGLWSRYLSQALQEAQAGA